VSLLGPSRDPGALAVMSGTWFRHDIVWRLLKKLPPGPVRLDQQVRVTQHPCGADRPGVPTSGACTKERGLRIFADQKRQLESGPRSLPDRRTPGCRAAMKPGTDSKSITRARRRARIDAKFAPAQFERPRLSREKVQAEIGASISRLICRIRGLKNWSPPNSRLRSTLEVDFAEA